MKMIQCALIENRIATKPTKCTHLDHSCMHRVDGRCCWVESGDNDGFASRRNLSSNKFVSEAKKSVSKIKLLYLIDRYYEYIRSEYGIYPKKGEGKSLEFPFDYEGHIWSDEIIRKALSENNLEAFAKHLPNKSVNVLIDSLESLRIFFDNSN
jgi:hypothetical protein